MKNSLLLPTMLLIVIQAFAWGYMIRGWQQNDNKPPVVPNPVTEAEAEVVPLGSGKGFRYRGLLIDIDTNPDNPGVNIGPQWRYRMGYQDGYYGYEVNTKYADSYQYMRGHQEGAAARQAIQ